MKSNKIWILSMILILSLVGCKASDKKDSSIENTNIIESVSESSIENEKQDDILIFDQAYKIYINPSVQYKNTYYNDNGNEGQHMNDIANILYDMLRSKTNLEVSCNCSISGLSLSKSVQESNLLNVDYHFAIHSNAGGGSGSEVWVSSNNSSKEFGKSILDSLNDILPYSSRGIKYGDGKDSSLYEIKNVKAPTALIEILFHDEESQSLFIINNKKLIAESFYNAITTYLS